MNYYKTYYKSIHTDTVMDQKTDTVDPIDVDVLSVLYIINRLACSVIIYVSWILLLHTHTQWLVSHKFSLPLYNSSVVITLCLYPERTVIVLFHYLKWLHWSYPQCNRFDSVVFSECSFCFSWLFIVIILWCL